jgi:uncharacterized membrane protein
LTAVAEPAGRMMRRPLGSALRRRRRLRAGIVQLFYVIAGFGLGLLVPRIPVGFTVPSAKVFDSLLLVGAGIVTFIGVVYSLLLLVAQFGTTTFTPRLNLFRDAPVVGHAFGFFTGVLVFAFTAAFSLGTDDRTTGLVPIVLVLALVGSIALFRALQTGAFKSIQLASVLAQVVERGREVIDGVYPAERTGAGERTAPDELPPVAHEVRWTHPAAVLQVIDVPRLVRCAAEAGAVVELRPRPGDTIAERSLLAFVRGGTEDRFDDDIVSSLSVGPERTFEQDPALALRALVDIALRALSPAVNDPTTAAQAVDGIDSLLRTLAFRELEVGRVQDDQGSVRVVLALPTWDEYVGLAVDELIRAGPPSIQVQDRLERLLEELLDLTPPARHGPLERRLEELRRAHR